jgi:hypothetical protein
LARNDGARYGAPFIKMKFSQDAQFREFPRNQRKPRALSRIVLEFEEDHS